MAEREEETSRRDQIALRGGRKEEREREGGKKRHQDAAFSHIFPGEILFLPDAVGHYSIWRR